MVPKDFTTGKNIREAGCFKGLMAPYRLFCGSPLHRLITGNLRGY